MQRLFRRTSSGTISYLYREGDYPIIFLHGLGGSSNNWTRLVKYLNPEYSLYFIDLLGHGRTVAEGWDYSISDQCRMLKEFVESEGMTSYGLAGNSYGGWTALRFSSQYDSPDCLLLEDSAGLNPTVGEGTTQQVDRFISRLQNFGRENDREVMKRIIEQNALGSERISQELLSRIRSRSIIVWGEKDRMIDTSYGRKLHESISGSEFRVIEGAGHVPHYTHPEEVASIVNDFCVFD